MNKQHTKTVSFILIFISFFIHSTRASSFTNKIFKSQIEDTTHPAEVTRALALSGTNRASLEKVLKHYKSNTIEYRAACFLIANMPYHSIGGRISNIDRRVDSIVAAADKAYYEMIATTTAKQQESNPLHAQIKAAAKTSAERNAKIEWNEPMVEENERADILCIDGDFIKKQVDYCCKLRRNSKILQSMPEKDFFEYILPYRSISSYPLVTTADTLGGIYAKYLMADTTSTSRTRAERYNRATWWLRHWGGEFPFESTIGWREMFFSRGFHDCVDIAFYGAQIFRSCGWPAAVEYNTAYKTWSGKHFDVVTPSHWGGEWQSFSPETEVPRPAEKRFKDCLNIYRMHFAPQKDSPAMLHAQDEIIPEEFQDPCIEDVTANYTETALLTLPTNGKIPQKNKLAYLATFKSHTGWEPVTWGIVDEKDRKTVHFKHVVTNHIYQPMALDAKGQFIAIGAPFKLESTGTKHAHLTVQSPGMKLFSEPDSQTQTVSVEIARKFPRKPSMIAYAKRAIGTIVVGSDSANFKHADTLATITSMPTDEWTDLPLISNRPYKFYRICAPKNAPHIVLAEIQFLTSKEHGYPNTCNPISKDGTNKEDSTWVRLLDEPLEQSRKQPQYDGNVQTAPERKQHVTFTLKEAQKVECLRFMVKNEDNHVKTGNLYVLHKATPNGWTTVWQGMTKTNHLPPLNLSVGTWYWLELIGEGQEELPFLIHPNGSIEFPHSWLLERS